MGKQGTRLEPGQHKQIQHEEPQKKTDTHVVAHYLEHGPVFLQATDIQTDTNWTGAESRTRGRVDKKTGL